MKVLLIHRDRRFGGSVVDLLGAHGFYTVWRRCGAGTFVLHHDADVVLLDLGVTDVNSLDLLRRMRGASTVPVLAMNGQDDESAAAEALGAGAVDYLATPIGMGELLAKIKAVARWPRLPGGRVYKVADLSIYLDVRTVVVGDELVSLTAREFDVLAVLARGAGQAVHRRQIMRTVWGTANVSLSRSLNVHMTSLRAKLNRPELLHTIRGYGYRLAPPFATTLNAGSVEPVSSQSAV